MKIAGDCTKRAADFLLTNNEYVFGRMMLAHGFVYNSKLGKHMPHAWVEDDVFCYDRLTEEKETRVFLKAQYYETGQIQEIWRYSRKAMVDLMLKFETYGFWEKALNDWYDENGF